jgi:hypothetical protein
VPPQPQPDRSERRFSLLNKFLATLTALFALATAVFGLWTAQVTQDKKDAQAEAESSGAQASALQGQNDQLKTENSDLQSRLNGPTASAIPLAAPTERNSGQVTLSVNGNTADLDSPRTDPQWQTADSDVSFYGYNTERQVRFSVPVIRIPTTADYDTCRSTTGYRQGNYDATEIVPGQYFCLKTNGKRYSAVKIIGLTPQQLVIDVVTYDPPGN